MDVCMGGRVAEELIFGPDEVTSGASSDIQQATKLARAMVTKFGLSDKVGVMHLDEQTLQSGETQRYVDGEVRRLLTESYERATSVLKTHRKELDILANGLLEYESLSGQEIVGLLKGKKPDMKNRSQGPSRDLKEITRPLGGRSPGGTSGPAPSFGSSIAKPPSVNATSK
jgi:ATP-dependent Zn protease